MGTKMPKNATWPDGIGQETMTGMGSGAGCCDSFLSIHSGFSDDSMEHLSPEEKACLLFLEETIESLDTEDDSGPSNDESDKLPVPGSLAATMANLSASISNSKLNSSPIHTSNELLKATSKDHRYIHSYLVPTPLIVANSSTTDKNIIHLKPQFSASHLKPVSQHNLQQSAPHIVEVNDRVQASCTNTKNNWESQSSQGPLSRGPLSYEALVHLRRSASTKKSPLCPTLDHTIDLARHPPTTKGAGNHPNHGSQRKSPSESPTQVSQRSKTSPPLVAPKPNISISLQTGTVFPMADSSSSGKRLLNPQKVRIEALQKLGLMKNKEPVKGDNILLPPFYFESPSDLSSKRFVRDPYYANPSRSPSFCYSQEPKGRPVQSSASFHCYSRNDQSSTVPSQTHQTSGVKITSVEHSNARGYCVKMMPGMGKDRKEALRKLGLLKD